MCAGLIRTADIELRYGIKFSNYFASSIKLLQALKNDGLVQIEAAQISVTQQGRLLLRNIAMCFDAYLAQQNSINLSKAI